ncbi:MAG: FAD-dependent oxidoreductase, partial [Myxococcota bacterium]
SSSIARELLRTVADAGGWTRIRADVDQILIEGGRAVGVRLVDGEEIRAPKVISAAGIASTLERLLPESIRTQDWAQPIRKLRPASAHVCLYLGFKGDIRQHGAGSANKWFYNTWDNEQEAWDVSNPEQLGQVPILYCSFPSLKDPDYDPGPEQLHTGEVVTFVPWEDFEPWLGTAWKNRGEDYEATKKALEARLLADFLEHMPSLEPLIDHVELSTPLSTDNFCRPMRGSIYGLEPTPERFRTYGLRATSPIDGLYFAGSEVASVGVIGAMVGGMLAAVAAEPLRGVDYIRRV